MLYVNFVHLKKKSCENKVYVPDLVSTSEKIGKKAERNMLARKKYHSPWLIYDTNNPLKA
jgi:hypothetical protein